jgi:hypothetical protein
VPDDAACLMNASPTRAVSEKAAQRRSGVTGVRTRSRAPELPCRRWICDKRPVLGPVVRLAQSVLLNILIRFGFKKVRGLPYAECR